MEKVLQQIVWEMFSGKMFTCNLLKFEDWPYQTNENDFGFSKLLLFSFDFRLYKKEFYGII